MFDIGFSELLLIGAVALIVIGPERLPGVARTLGHLFGRMQRYVNEVKSDIQREMELDELRKLRESVESSAREIEQSVSREFNQAEDEMREIQALVDPGPARPTEPGKLDPRKSEPAASEPGTSESGIPEPATFKPGKPEASADKTSAGGGETAAPPNVRPEAAESAPAGTSRSA